MAQPADADAETALEAVPEAALEAAPEAAPDAAEAAEARMSKAREAGDAPDDSDGSGDSEPGEARTYPRRMTPLEFDMQLQIAELTFRSILEGKRMALHPAPGAEAWQAQVLGPSWMAANRRMRNEIQRQMKADGENTPEWMESLAGMSDLAWQAFAWGKRGEVLRSLAAVDRAEVLELLKELRPKLRDSHYARCGAGDRLQGPRACVGVLRLFILDPEVLELTAQVLTLATQGHDYNRSAVCEVFLPLPPEERQEGQREVGWSFLRHALDAVAVQAGAMPFGGYSPGDDPGGRPGPEATPPVVARSPEAAVTLAECIVAMRSAPAMQAQLELLREPAPAEGMRPQRLELKQMLAGAYAKVQELARDFQSNESLPLLLEMLREAGAELPQEELFEGPVDFAARGSGGAAE